MVVYATCNIVMKPVVRPKPTRARLASINMDIVSRQAAGLPAPITIVIKGKRFARVVELMTLYQQPDDVIAKKTRNSVLHSEVEGMDDEQIAEWVRGNIIAELEEMGAG